MEKNRPHLLQVCSPSGALIEPEKLDRAALALQNMGFQWQEMPFARARQARFAGTVAQRIADLEQALANTVPSLVLCSRGGYGVSRLLPHLPLLSWAERLRSTPHVVCGHSDITALQLALLAVGAPADTLLHGPMACFDFGDEVGPHPTTLQYFLSALKGHIQIEWLSTWTNAQAIQGEGAQSTDEHSLNGLMTYQGPVWGGNLSLLSALVGTPWMPNIQSGILIVEDVNEPVYKLERMLLQLLHAGILQQQQVLLLGQFGEPAPTAHDQDYNLARMAEWIQAESGIPVLNNFPFGHCTPKACWYQGARGVLENLHSESGSHWRLTQNLND